MKSKLLLVGAAIAASPLLMASSCSTHGDSDYANVNHAPADVVEFPDGFRNVASKCDGPNRVYSGSAGSDDAKPAAVAVVPNDPRCTGTTK